MIKAYAIFDDSVKSSYLPLLYPNRGVIEKKDRLFTTASAFTTPLFEFVDDPRVAEVLLIPYDFFSIPSGTTYLERYRALSDEHGKKVLVFDFSDLDLPIDIPHALVFRTSQYAYKIKPNEFIMPPLIEDLGARGVPSPRAKEERPIIGFCGWAGFPSFSSRLRYLGKVGWGEVSAWFGGTHLRSHKPGLYFRRKALRILERARAVDVRMIIRTSYSGHRSTIGLSPEDARREYIENITTTDFTLSPKGDGNYSARFFETLSLGRIPLLIDTETVLPLEDELSYDECVLRVKSDEMGRLGEIVAAWYHGLTDSAWVERQRQARKIFEEALSPSAFFYHHLPRIVRNNL